MVENDCQRLNLKLKWPSLIWAPNRLLSNLNIITNMKKNVQNPSLKPCDVLINNVSWKNTYYTVDESFIVSDHFAAFLSLHLQEYGNDCWDSFSQLWVSEFLNWAWLHATCSLNVKGFMLLSQNISQTDECKNRKLTNYLSRR